MKTALASLALGTFILLFSAPTATVRAGSAVATDGHGAYGFAYGDYPLGELRFRAVRNCRRNSECPDAVRVVFNTSKKGCGTILRFHTGGGLHIAAAGGTADLRTARHRAACYVEENGGGENWEEVETWSDD